MECNRCKAQNPDGKKFCGDCGNSLEYGLAALIDDAVSKKVEAETEKRLKDYKQTESDVTERVANRLLGWFKIVGGVVGFVVLVAGALGVKSVLDIKTGIDTETDGLKKQIDTETQGLKQEVEASSSAAADLERRVKSATTNLAPLTEQEQNIKGKYEELETDLSSVQQTKDKLSTVTQQVKVMQDEVNATRIGLNAEEHRTDGIQTLLAGFQPVPHPTGSLHLNLETVIGKSGVEKIRDSGSLTLQAAGATGGVKDNSFQVAVAEQLRNQFKGGSAQNPAFFYILGNVTFFDGSINNYYSQFYEPYSTYPAPIFAVPGSHDGAPGNTNEPSLDGFMRTFCAKTPIVDPISKDAPRVTMIQPNVYWTLDTPFATLIGIYTNVTEGGQVDPEQKQWFFNEMKAAPLDKSLIVLMYHPVFSFDVYHSGSARMGQLIEGAIDYAGRAPDLVLAGQVHGYQRITHRWKGAESVYIVAGGGGYPILQQIASNLKPPMTAPDTGAILESYDVQHGFVQITVSRTSLSGRYFSVAKTGTGSSAEIRDSFTFDLLHHQLLSNKLPK